MWHAATLIDLINQSTALAAGVQDDAQDNYCEGATHVMARDIASTIAIPNKIDVLVESDIQLHQAKEKTIM